MPAKKSKNELAEMVRTLATDVTREADPREEDRDLAPLAAYNRCSKTYWGWQDRLLAIKLHLHAQRLDSLAKDVMLGYEQAGYAGNHTAILMRGGGQAAEGEAARDARLERKLRSVVFRRKLFAQQLRTIADALPKAEPKGGNAINPARRAHKRKIAEATAKGVLKANPTAKLKDIVAEGKGTFSRSLAATTAAWKSQHCRKAKPKTHPLTKADLDGHADAKTRTPDRIAEIAELTQRQSADEIETKRRPQRHNSAD